MTLAMRCEWGCLEEVSLRGNTYLCKTHAEIYDSPHTVPRMRHVVLLRRTFPDWPASKIAAVVGVSRERVRQILEREGLRTTRVSYRQTTLCKTCGKEISRGAVYCRLCEDATHRVLVTCFEDGMPFFVKMSRYKRVMKEAMDPAGRYKGIFFHNRVCSGRRAGREFGFGRRLSEKKSL